MAIRMRRGLESELDISQAVPGEWLVSTDTRYIRMCFAPGIVLRMATYESFEEDMKEIQKILDECQTIEEAVSKIYEEIKDVAVDVERIESAAESAFQSEQNALSSANNASDFANISSEKSNIAIDKAEEAKNNAKISEEKALEATNAAGVATSKAEEAKQNANNAENMADISKSYAVGDTGARLGEDIDNSKYYSEIAKIEADRAKSEADKAESVVNIGVATVEKAGIVKPDGTTITVDENGTIHSVGGGTADYNSLENKPSINGVELFGNKTTSDLGINQAIGNKLDKTGDSKDNTVTFTQESERSNITSNEKHSTIFGKISKWFSDLKTVAFSGSYNDLSNKPTIPTKVSELENDSGYATDEELKKTTELVAINKQTLGYGKKNLLKNTATTYTTNGVTYTVNNDGSVTANGTATADASINLSDFSLTNPSNSHVETLKSGNYILSGISGGSDTTYFIQYRDMTRSLSQDARDGDKVISVVNGNNVYVIIRVKAGITVNNLTFYPMIRSADIEDGTYEPYVDDVDTRIESLNTALNKAVSSSLNGRNFSTLEEFVEATNPNDVSHGHMFRFKDIGGWMPLGGTSDWYACIVQYQNRYVAGSTASVDGKIHLLTDKNRHWTGYVYGNKDSGLTVYWDKVVGASDTLNTLEEISANTKEEMIAGALALKEINGNINRDFYGTNGYSQAFDLIPNNDVTAPLSRLGSCYISNEEEVTTYHAPETGYAFAFGKNVTRYAIIFIGTSKVWYRRYPIGWKEL